jgi:hypothetical protein
MVGSLEATSSGHKTNVKFLENKILFHFPKLGDVSRLQQILPAGNVSIIPGALRALDQSVFVKIGGRKPFEVFPQPSWIVRLLSPSLRSFAQSEDSL